jgi:hypothetical protein
MKPALGIVLLLSISIPSFAAVPAIPAVRPKLTAAPASPVRLGTQIVLSLAGEFSASVERGESILLSFSARRAGEELQVVRPFARATSAKWTPSRAGTYELLATAQLKRRDGSVISEISVTLANYIVNAPPTPASKTSETAVTAPLVTIKAPGQGCTPGDRQVAFFVDAQYSGKCVALAAGDYPTAGSIGLPNDSISSIRLGAAAQVYACRDDYYQGPCELITASTANLTGSKVGNDAISSVKVQPSGMPAGCVPILNQVAFFIDSNFSGGCVLRGPGAYPTAQAIGLPNDSVSSLKLGATAQVIVCRDNDYRGDCQLFTADVANLGSERIGNDTVSSAKVEVRGTQDCKPGAQQVGFFMHDNYVSPCSLKDLGAYPNAVAIGLPNDSLSSVLVGQGAQAILCVDDNYGGDCQRFTASAPHLGSERIGNDRVSSAKVERAGEYECNPGPNQVAFFVHDDYIGPCSVRGFGDYANAQALGVPNDSTSSIVVGSQAQVVLYVDVNYGGDGEKFTASAHHLGDSKIGNDRVSSARVQPRNTVDCPNGANQVAVFMHSNFLYPCTVRPLGDYSNAAAIGVSDNSISSIRVGASVEACVCDGPNFTVECHAFGADTAYVGDYWNDKISSMRVLARGAQCKAVTQPQVGVKEVQISNCHPEQRSVHIWTFDATTNEYVDHGSAASNWSGGQCPVGSPFSVSLTSGDQMQIIAVDPAADVCGGHNDPQVSACQKLVTQFMTGDSNGTVVQLTIQ